MSNQKFSNRKAFPHLTGCVNNLTSNDEASGLCFHRAAALVLDLEGAELCIGTLAGATPEQIANDPRVSPTPFIHAWVEHNDLVYAPTTIERAGNSLIGWPKATYYEYNGVKDVTRLARNKIFTLSGVHGWSAHFRHAKPLRTDISLGKAVLEAAGVQYTVSERGGVVPA